MIKSMTGYGRGEWQGEHKRIEAEVLGPSDHWYLEGDSIPSSPEIESPGRPVFAIC